MAEGEETKDGESRPACFCMLDTLCRPQGSIPARIRIQPTAIRDHGAIDGAPEARSRRRPSLCRAEGEQKEKSMASTATGQEDAVRQRPVVVGLTGSIGMGKSTCSEFARDAGIPVFDSDAVVHDLYRQGGAAVGPIRSRFGDGVLNEQGGVDRPALGRHVLNQPEAMADLEGIVHPLVQQAREQWTQEQADQKHKVVVIDIPLLYETGAEKSVDFVMVASASEQTQRERVLARAGMTQEKMDAILSRQVPDKEKRRRADFIIDTNLSLEETRASLLEFLDRLKNPSV